MLSARWTRAYGGWPTSGPASHTRTSRCVGSSPGTSACSTPPGETKWIFGSRNSGFYLRKLAWTPIVRHRMVAGTASPDDPSLTDYWAQRRRRSQPPIGTTTLRLLRVQHGRCPLCRGLLLRADHEPQSPREWEQWLTTARTAIRKHAIPVWAVDTPDERVANRLIHAHCQRRLTGNGHRPSTSALPVSLQSLLEPGRPESGHGRF